MTGAGEGKKSTRKGQNSSCLCKHSLCHSNLKTDSDKRPGGHVHRKPKDEAIKVQGLPRHKKQSGYNNGAVVSTSDAPTLQKIIF